MTCCVKIFVQLQPSKVLLMKFILLPGALIAIHWKGWLLNVLSLLYVGEHSKAASGYTICICWFAFKFIHGRYGWEKQTHLSSIDRRSRVVYKYCFCCFRKGQKHFYEYSFQSQYIQKGLSCPTTNWLQGNPWNGEPFIQGFIFDSNVLFNREWHQLVVCIAYLHKTHNLPDLEHVQMYSV